ncbi:MAG: Zn-dependent hydrolase [Bacteroidia bacterium]|nr:Zn-dependent hydrolase [Bacteroidia bacterium]MDG2041288.1 Zn-dependent hydrolase [Bacteroidia bacterium]
MSKSFYPLLLISVLIFSCQDSPSEDTSNYNSISTYMPVKLTSDLDALNPNEKDMLPHLFAAADIMNDLFWVQAFGNKETLLASIASPKLRKFAEINYGPWDRLNDNAPFLDNVELKPLGSNFYPADMTKEEFEELGLLDEKGLYSMVRRDEAGKLYTIPYHEFFRNQLEEVSGHLLEAAEICEDSELKKYLELKSKALLTDNYTESDIAWINMRNNTLDIIIGPTEHYEDALYNYRTAYEAYILVKDKAWSKKLEKYIELLPQLQAELPVADEYKQETPNTDAAQLNAYDVIYYAGDCNSGSKTIAVNLPNDEEIQIKYGTRRSQLKNAMKAKFDHILLPISNILIDKNQRKHITFNAFFSNTMFHEVAHGLGIKETVNGQGSVREALGETFSALEEGKADILGLHMITQLREKRHIEDGELMDYYVTFLAGIFRSVRFGASSAHGKANMLRFNYFKDHNAFTRNNNGSYSVNFDEMKEAIKGLSSLILRLQGDGNKTKVLEIMTKNGIIKESLQKDLDRLSKANIPVDIVFEQGLDVLGLQ